MTALLTKATTIKVPKKKLSAYKKLFKQKGLSSKVKVKDIKKQRSGWIINHRG